MFKFTIVGAAILFATVAARHAAPAHPQDVLEEYVDALDRANVTDLNEYQEDVRDFMFDELVGDLEEYEDATIECYDVDGDGALNRSEFDTFIQHTLSNRPMRCPAMKPPKNLTSAERTQLISWIANAKNVAQSNIRLQQIYASVPTNFSRDVFMYRVNGYSGIDFVALGRSKADGRVFGAFTSLKPDWYIGSY